MKLQHLAIIFVIIILPIALVVGEYVQLRIDTISLQTQYSSKLQTATYDSIKAFRLNTINNKFSTVSDSKIRDIQASVSTFFNSLGDEMGQGAFIDSEMTEYVPAIVYTLYDGYYIYSKYYDEAIGKYQYGLKPYIYYSCRYKHGNIDIVINYTLDDYITIYGYDGDNFITKSGNIINPDLITDIKYSNEEVVSLKYGGVEITKEALSEQIIYLDSSNTPVKDNKQYYYAINDNNKIYYDDVNNSYFLINSNSKKQYIVDKETLDTLKHDTENGILYSKSALKYYNEAYKFSLWARQYLGNITQKDAVDEKGNSITDFANNTGDSPIFKFNGKLDITDSTFDLNRISVIRKSIESNLITAIANYNHLVQNTYSYAMPVFTQEDWYKITNNISVISFMQGIPIGAKYFNDYSIITNNVNKELVTLNSLYVITEDSNGTREIHLADCKDILDRKLKIIKVYKNIDFERQSVVVSEDNEVYYYPHYDTRCYNCIVNIAETYNIDYIEGTVKDYNKKTEEYDQISVDENTLYSLRKEVLQALAREKYDLYKVNDYFKGYNETIGAESITQTEDTNIEIMDIRWNPVTGEATVRARKKSMVAETLKIQYQVNGNNSSLSNNAKWIQDDNTIVVISGLKHKDKIYFRLFDGIYDGDYRTYTVLDTNGPTMPLVEVVDGQKGNKVEGTNWYWYRNDIVKVQITPGDDKESGYNRTQYSFEGAKNLNDRTYSKTPTIINVAENGKTNIKAITYDNGENSTPSVPVVFELYKDSLAPNAPTIEIVSGNLGNNGFYTSDLKIKLNYGEDIGPSGIDNMQYEIIYEGNNADNISGTAANGQEFPINYNGKTTINAYMKDNAGNVSGTTSLVINLDKAKPVITKLYASNITTKSFRLNIITTDSLAGIDRIVWYYRKNGTTNYNSITSNCNGEKGEITKYVDINNLTSGKYNTYAEVYDKAGNKTTTSILNVTTLSVEKAGGATATPTSWTNQNVTVTLPTKTDYITQYQTGTKVNVNGTWTTYTGKLTITANTTVFYRYNDGINAGDYGSITIANIDKAVPGNVTVTYNGGSNTCSWKNNYNITLSATDTGGSGISHYEIDWNGDGNADSTTNANFIPWNEFNSHTTRFRAVDNAGNKGAWTGNHHIHMDTTIPTHTQWWWGEVNTTVARLYIRATDNIQISSVQIQTSTQSGNYKNWKTINCVWDASANAYRADIYPSNWGHYGQTYISNLYIYDIAGNGGYYDQTSCYIPVLFEKQEFGYTGGIQTFSVPVTGKYKLEVWGASGGNSNAYPAAVGGKGGYSVGYINLTVGQTLYIVVGGKGCNANVTSAYGLDPNHPWKDELDGGYNGGAKGQAFGDGSSWGMEASGGGATHISKASGLLSDATARNNVLIVAGGGGGAYIGCDWPGTSRGGGNGGDGGGTNGEAGWMYWNDSDTFNPQLQGRYEGDNGGKNGGKGGAGDGTKFGGGGGYYGRRWSYS